MAERVAFSVEEMSQRIGVSRSFLYEQIKAGKLNTLKIGKRRLIRAEDEAAYLTAHRLKAYAS